MRTAPWLLSSHARNIVLKPLF